MYKATSVDDYINAHQDWRAILTNLRKIIHSTEMAETIKWGAPVYTISGKNVVAIGAFKSYAGLWFYNGALLKDENNILINAQEGKTKALRQWRFSELSELDEPLILKYLIEAIELQKAGKTVPKAKPKKEFEMPLELAIALKNSEQLAQQFQKLTPYKQEEFADHIGSAKREVTRISRLEKSIPLINDGIGLNDKYRNC